MRKVSIQNLAMIVDECCNLDCRQCMRGKKCNRVMGDAVIEGTLSQVVGIGNLSICGGEPTMAIEVIEKIIDYVITHRIIVGQVSATINGTIYSEAFLRALSRIEGEILKYSKYREGFYATFAISYDQYHLEEIRRLGLERQFIENVNKYKQSSHFAGFQTLPQGLKLFREGNACNLDDSLTVPYRPMEVYITYASKRKFGFGYRFDEKQGLANIGPLVCVNVDGIITECDVSFIRQRQDFNYGNVLTESIYENCLRRGRVLSPRKWYRKCIKEEEYHRTYQE